MHHSSRYTGFSLWLPAFICLLTCKSSSVSRGIKWLWPWQTFIDLDWPQVTLTRIMTLVWPYAKLSERERPWPTFTDPMQSWPWNWLILKDLDWPQVTFLCLSLIVSTTICPSSLTVCGYNSSMDPRTYSSQRVVLFQQANRWYGRNVCC